MAQLKIGSAPTKPVKEKREEALERLLLLVCSRLLPDDLSLLGKNQQVADEAISEAVYWLDFVPRGAKIHPTIPEKRLGWKEVQERADAYKLNEEGALVPATVAVPVTPSAPKAGAK